MTEELGPAPDTGRGVSGEMQAPVDDIQTTELRPTTELLEQFRTMYKLEAEWRSTGLGGRDEPIVFCPTCLEVLEATSFKGSRGGTHGKYVYFHRHPMVYINLIQSNRGNRRFWVRDDGQLTEEMRRDIEDIVRYMWVDVRADDEEVEEEVKKYLTAVKIARQIQQKEVSKSD